MYFFPAYNRGVFNRYRKGMPWSEMMMKDIAHLISNIKQRKNRTRLLCYPHYPSRGATIFRIAKALGIEITNKPTGRFDLAIYWEYATIRKEWKLLDELNISQTINLKSRDIGKDHLAEMMLLAFGYSTKVDPTTFEGNLVRKSIQNAVHDGTLVQGPLTPDEGFVYQRLVDSSVSETEVMDMRIPIMKDTVPHLYRAYRSSEARFVNVPPRVALETDVDSLLSSSEKEQLFALARLLGMDYAEFDVLRDCHDNRIYVVDANNTPQGPPKNLTEEEKLRSIKSYADCFNQQFLAAAKSNA